MNNQEFLQVLKKSFISYLKTSARSNQKLKILHGAISNDLYERLNDKNNNYNVYSLGYNNGSEYTIKGRYLRKVVDITITDGEKSIAGIAVKYIMSNYFQNSNNYFENMLGETANIRSANIPYFQIFVIPDKIPYFDQNGEIMKWETLNEHNVEKYIKLSVDNINEFMHTPNKVLFFVVHINSENGVQVKNRQEYIDYYTHNDFDMQPSTLKFDFGSNVIYNDYDIFIDKVTHYILSI